MAPRAYNNRTRLQQQAELKARIAEAAAELHRAQGALATSWAQIAERAGVSVPTVYKHFPTLDTLVQSCTAHVAAQAPAFPQQKILEAADLGAAVDALVAGADAAHAHFAPWSAWREHHRIPALAAILAHERARMLALCEAVLACHLGPGDHRAAAAWWESLLAFDLRDRLLVEHGQSRAAYRRTLVHLLLVLPDRSAPARLRRVRPRGTEMTQPQARIDRIAEDTWRISVAMPPELVPGGFSFNQYLVVDERPLLFHTGPRRLFGLVRAQIETVLPLQRLRYVAFSHVEADECGSLAEFLQAAPQAQPVCSRVAAMVSIGDLTDREAVAMEDGQVLDLGRHQLVWQSTPHLPHGWECGYLFDRSTGTLFCGDLFTQPGTGGAPLTQDDILAPSETFRRQEDYFSHSRNAPALIEKLAALRPRLLACMHGSAWQGDGAALLRQLGRSLAAA